MMYSEITLKDTDKIKNYDLISVSHMLKNYGLDVYDNEGNSADRYTLFIYNKKIFNKEGDKVGSVYGSSSNPFHPQGFFQFSHMGINLELEHCGKLIDVNDLPFAVLLAMSHRLD